MTASGYSVLLHAQRALVAPQNDCDVVLYLDYRSR